MSEESRVFVIDDDADMRLSLQWLLESAGLRVWLFDSAEAFLAADVHRQPGCLLLDVRMPGMGGIRLLEQLGRMGCRLPVIMFTGHGDIAMAVQTMKAGAFDFLEKPASHQLIIGRVQEALEKDRLQRSRQQDLSDMEQRLQQLTPREREILERLTEGLSTREISACFGISERTVEKHRERLIQKLNARSVVDVVRRVMEHRNGAEASPTAP